MAESTKQLTRHINKILAREANPFFAVVDKELRLVTASGKGNYYGYGSLKEGQSTEDAFAFLIGLEEIPDQTLKLHTLETPSGKAADVHLLRLEEGWGVAFLDATEGRESQRVHQQSSYDLTLLGIKREKLLEKIKAAQEELETTNKELALANRLKGRFIGRMSHEFRTPLSSVLGFAELAKEDLGYPNRAMSHLKAIERGANYLLNLVDNLVDQAVSENDSIKIHPTSCDITHTVEELEQLFQPMADQKGLTLAWWIAAEVPSRVWLDEMRLRQVLVNLLGNAFKFTREGGITVSLDWADEELTVSVEDTGPGIQESDIANLFEAFRQSSDEKHEGKGAGLGLSISREIVRLMGGDMEFTAPSGQGTCVGFTVAAPSRMETTKTTQSLDGAKVLVIDDDDDIRQLLQVFLNSAGSETSLARGSKEALRSVAQATPDLVVVDMQLGDDSGVDLIKEMRERDYSGKIVGLSANESEGQRQKALKAGCADYILKPIRRTEFLQRLEETLSAD